MPINNTNHTEAENLTCAECGGSRITTRWQSEFVSYGDGSDAVQLSCTVPVRSCRNCAAEFTDSVADDLRHETICKHLGVMTPRDIIGIRKNYGLTRAKFAEITGIGEASLARWETGQLIQNRSVDQLLYLLTFLDNIERLRSRYTTELLFTSPQSRETQERSRLPVFRVLELKEDLFAAARGFALRPVYTS